MPAVATVEILKGTLQIGTVAFRVLNMQDAGDFSCALPDAITIEEAVEIGPRMGSRHVIGEFRRGDGNGRVYQWRV